MLKKYLFVLVPFLLLSACEQNTAENKATDAQNSIHLTTSNGKRINNIQIAYVSHEYDWKPGDNIILPADFPVSDLSEYFVPLTGSHVNPEFKMIQDEKWLRVPLVQIKSLHR